MASVEPVNSKMLVIRRLEILMGACIKFLWLLMHHRLEQIGDLIPMLLWSSATISTYDAKQPGWEISLSGCGPNIFEMHVFISCLRVTIWVSKMES